MKHHKVAFLYGVKRGIQILFKDGQWRRRKQVSLSYKIRYIRVRLSAQLFVLLCEIASGIPGALG